MRIIRGNLWNEYIHGYDAVCCTTNMCVKKDGSLVMGAGIAKQFADRFPILPKTWGHATCKINNGYLKSGLIVTKYYEENNFIIDIVSFPTKYNWKDKSSLRLIEKSAEQLCMISYALNWSRILLPKPGCSNGGLKWKEVSQILSKILDNRFFIISR